MRTRLGVLVGAVVVALALVSSGAVATVGARIASSCRVRAVRPEVGKVTQRVVLHGKVSCSQARRTYLAFLRAEDSGACGSGRICGVLQAGGWQCSFLSSVESKEDGGLQARCSRKGSSFGVYNVAAKTGRARDPAAVARAGSLKGVIGLNFTGGRVHGYRVSLGGAVGTPGASQDVLSLVLTKTTGGLAQSHSWGVKLAAGEININRSKASIVVDDPLGPGGADGELNFTFSGPPHLQSLKRLFGCNSKHNVIYGTLTGTIRIKVGDHFFKTITVTRMTGWAVDTYTTNVCLAPCPSPYYIVDGSGPFSLTKPVAYLEAGSPGGKRRPSTVAVSVFDPTVGTPFLEINHELGAEAPKSFVSSNPNLTRAQVKTPGGVLSGSLSLKSSGPLHKLAPSVCKGGHYPETFRYAKVTKGRITATFDSIGKFSLGTNLNSPGPGGSRPDTLISHVS